MIAPARRVKPCTAFVRAILWNRRSKAGVASLVAVGACLAAPAAAGTGAPQLPGAPACTVFPSNSPWNTDISDYPVDAKSRTYIDAMGSDVGVHPDFGSGTWNGGPIGIPYNVVGPKTRKYRLGFEYADESDKGPYPIPRRPKIEGGNDRHILVVDRRSCKLYEIYRAERSGHGWKGGSGAVFDLRSNALRPDSWTSADAAGLPILPGLARYEEFAEGSINHALRFTAARTRSDHIYPARHDASDSDDPALPPMGLRVRLKDRFDTTEFPAQVRVVLEALKRYGMILADNGADWYVSGAPDERWDNDALHTLDRVKGSDFEVVDTSSMGPAGTSR